MLGAACWCWEARLLQWIWNCTWCGLMQCWDEMGVSGCKWKVSKMKHHLKGEEKQKKYLFIYLLSLFAYSLLILLSLCITALQKTTRTPSFIHMYNWKHLWTTENWVHLYQSEKCNSNGVPYPNQGWSALRAEKTQRPHASHEHCAATSVTATFCP